MLIASLIVLTYIFLPISLIFMYGLPSILAGSAFLDAVAVSFRASLKATLIAIGLGVPLAYILSRYNFPIKEVVRGIIDVPVVVPHTVAGIGLLLVFGTHGIIGAPLSYLGMKFVDAEPGIVCAMLFVSVPYAINHAYEGFQHVDIRLEYVARSLGASKFKTFTSISLPLVSKDIISGGIMCWARGVSEFGAVVIIAYYPTSATPLIYERFTTEGLIAALGPSAFLLTISIILFTIVRFISERGDKWARH